MSTGHGLTRFLFFSFKTITTLWYSSDYAILGSVGRAAGLEHVPGRSLSAASRKNSKLDKQKQLRNLTP